MKKINPVIIILMFILWFSCLPSLHAADESMEYKLAVIDGGGYISKDDISIARFRSLLKQLSSTYVETRAQIGDMTVTAQQLLKKEGISESLRNIMEGMNQLFSGKVKNQKYSEYMAMYITLRTKGHTHQKAIDDIKAIRKEATASTGSIQH